MRKITKNKNNEIMKIDEYDKNNNLIYSKTFYRYPITDVVTGKISIKLETIESWFEYDAYGRRIHFKDSTGLEEFYEYEED